MIVALLSAVFTACAPHSVQPAGPASPVPDVPAGMPAALWDLARPVRTLSYTECSTIAPGVGPVCVLVDEAWTGPVQEGENAVWDVTVQEGTGEDRRVREVQRVYYGPAGMGWLGTGVRGRPYAAFDAPEKVLPPDPEPGQAWTETFFRGGHERVRSCEVRAAPGCAGGVVSHCDTTFPDKHVILDVHFCPGVGMVGYEGRVVPGGSIALRVWSTEFRRDGQPTALFQRADE